MSLMGQTLSVPTSVTAVVAGVGFGYRQTALPPDISGSEAYSEEPANDEQTE